MSLNSTTVAYNATDDAVEISRGGSPGGAILNAPKQGRYVYGAKMRFLTDNGAATNYFGLCMRRVQPPGNDWTGIHLVHYQTGDAPNLKSWYAEFLTSGGSAQQTLFKIDQNLSGVPQYAKNIWFDFRIEVDTVRFTDDSGISKMRFYVNDFLLGEYTTPTTGVYGTAMYPGVKIQNGLAQVRQVYSSSDIPTDLKLRSPSYLATTEISAKSEQLLGARTAGSKADSYPTSSKNYYFGEDSVISGRILDYSFNKKIEKVWIVDSNTLRVAGRTTTDADGNYAFPKMDSTATYVIMVDRDGKKKTVPTVNYVGHGILAGTVRIAGDVAEGVKVRVFSEESNEFLGEVVTDVNGQFEIPNVLNGHAFCLVFRDPLGAWEDRVSSRRIAVAI